MFGWEGEVLSYKVVWLVWLQIAANQCYITDQATQRC